MCSRSSKPNVPFETPYLVNSCWQTTSVRVSRDTTALKLAPVIDIAGRYFERDSLLRKTKFSTVFRGVELTRDTNEDQYLVRSTTYVAIKEVRKVLAHKTECQESILAEIAALRALTRLEKGMSNYIESCQTADHYYVITELCAGADLFSYIDSGSWRHFNESKCRKVFTKLIENFQNLHHLGWAHRDASPENVLYDPANNDEVVIIDYSMSLRHACDEQSPPCSPTSPSCYRHKNKLKKFCKIDNNTVGNRRLGCGKRGYRSPESFLNPMPDLDFRCDDVWALGVILFVMLTGSGPFESAREDDGNYHYIAVQRNLAAAVSHWHFPLSAEVVDLMQHMLLQNPQERLTVDQVLDHPWMQPPDAGTSSVLPHPDAA